MFFLEIRTETSRFTSRRVLLEILVILRSAELAVCRSS